MRFSGTGYVDENGVFQLHRNILESLSIFDDSILFGIFYPYPDKSGLESQIGESMEIDFLFSPIPYLLWPKAASIKLKVTKQSTAIKEISKILKLHNVTILNSTSSRSSDNSSTWELHIAFESLHFADTEIVRVESNYKDCDDKLSMLDVVDDFDSKKNYYTTTSLKIETLIKVIKSSPEANKLICKIDGDESDYNIQGRPNKDLHRAYYESMRLKRERIKSRQSDHNKESVNFDRMFIDLKNEMYDFIFNSFTLRYVRGNLIVENDNFLNVSRIISNSGGKINNILYLSQRNKEKQEKRTGIKFNYTDVLPAATFVEANSHYLAIRVHVIQKKLTPHFFKLSVFYRRQNNPYSSRGLLEYISNNLPDNLHIWKYHNRLYECRETYGSGKLSFYLEDINPDSNYERSTSRDNILAIIDQLHNEINQDHFDNRLGHLKHFELKASVDPIRDVITKHFRINKSAIGKQPYDVFISFSSRDKADAEFVESILKEAGLNCFLSSKQLHGGDLFSEKIREALVSSREFCLLYSPTSKNSSWVTTEWGAAWSVNKRITPILLDITVDLISPDHDRLKSLHYIRFRENEIREYAQDVFKRRFTPFL